jgi:hypothetical protein
MSVLGRTFGVIYKNSAWGRRFNCTKFILRTTSYSSYNFSCNPYSFAQCVVLKKVYTFND